MVIRPAGGTERQETTLLASGLREVGDWIGVESGSLEERSRWMLGVGILDGVVVVGMGGGGVGNGVMGIGWGGGGEGREWGVVG